MICSPPRGGAGAVVLAILEPLDVSLDVVALGHEDDRVAVYPHRDPLYTRIGRDGLAGHVVNRYRSHIVLIIRFFFHIHRLPVDRPGYADPTFLV